MTYSTKDNKRGGDRIQRGDGEGLDDTSCQGVAFLVSTHTYEGGDGRSMSEHISGWVSFLNFLFCASRTLPLLPPPALFSKCFSQLFVSNRFQVNN